MLVIGMFYHLEGYAFRSNFLKHYMDISPAFDIENFKKLINKIKKKLINNETV